MAVALTLIGRVAAAQDKPPAAVPVPESAMPPAGMCRVWLPTVPEARQPAPTDCATAIRTMPRDASVIFGDLKRAGKVAPDRSNTPRMVAVPGFRGAGAAAQMMPPQRGVVGVGAQAVAPGGASAATKAADEKASARPIKP